jgi:hypothetical protein
MTYEVIQEKLKNWGFVRDYAWYLNRKSTAKETALKRDSLSEDLHMAKRTSKIR